jgi:protoporphyrin/coproporphyrin ferrochelatase
MNEKYDALLVVSFGGPEGPDDVMPFLENVLRGRSVPRERMELVAKQYEQFGGVSPQNEHNRNLIKALTEKLEESGPPLKIFWGNRNWHPYVSDAFVAMRDAGVKRALAFVTSAFSSYSGCCQYLEDIQRAQQELSEAPRVDTLRAFFNHPLFVAANAERLRSAIEKSGRDTGTVAFTAHSLPLSMAQDCSYQEQLHETSRLVAEAVGVTDWRLAFQSRSGPPTQPWLEPDIRDHLRQLASSGIDEVFVSPVGFLCDHMEVIYDLDVQAQETARDLGLLMIRVPTVGTHPLFIDMIQELILEKTDGLPARAIGKFAPLPDRCKPGCCLPK